MGKSEFDINFTVDLPIHFWHFKIIPQMGKSEFDINFTVELWITKIYEMYCKILCVLYKSPSDDESLF